jgi:7-cyano-7-deazaguanine synthase in queuosine biosynthesis
MITVSGVDIPLVSMPIAVNFSGGADSSILLYILMKYSRFPIHICTCVPNGGHGGHAQVSAAVVDRCVELTDNLSIQHHLWYQQESNDPGLLWNIESVLLNKLEVSTVYVGTTANPPRDVSDAFVPDHTEVFHLEDRDPTKQRKVIDQRKDWQFILPFTNVDKRKVMAMYRELVLVDTLLPLTRSCRSSTFKASSEPCGVCWSCKEREWGLT